ncbi:MAG: FGGY family carbohydrate kinase [Thermoguttaceae bacterium]
MSSTPTKLPVFLGVEMTPTGANIAAVTEAGEILAEVVAPYTSIQIGNSKTVREQDPQVWWDAVRMGLGQMIGKLRTLVASAAQLKAVCVCGVPGDILILDRNRSPLRPAILAADARAVDQIVSLSYIGQEHRRKLGTTFHPTDPLAKIAWIKENEPDLYDNAIFCHQADYIAMMLTSGSLVTEYSLATLTGCDSITEAWPDWIDYEMHLGVRERLPSLKPLGTQIGPVSKQASGLTGLPPSVVVILGASADTAGFLSSGVKKIGDCHTVIDKHISIHGISTKMQTHNQIQWYRLPGQRWYFATRCVTGAEWASVWFNEETTRAIRAKAEEALPTEYIAYPNVTGGETFPFTSNTAEGFITPATDNHAVQFAACLQGTAFFERLCYRRLQKIVDLPASGADIYTSGVLSRDDFWMQCRADVTARTNRRMQATNGVTFGAAIIAASHHHHGIDKASAAMVHIDRSFYPDTAKHALYNEHFQTFVDMMEQQGYQ